MKLIPLAAFAAVAFVVSPMAVAEVPLPAPAATAGSVQVEPGKMLYGPNGSRIANVYRVTSDGNPQVILDGRLVTVPASTLSDVGGKLTTSLGKRELTKSK